MRQETSMTLKQKQNAEILHDIVKGILVNEKKSLL